MQQYPGSRARLSGALLLISSLGLLLSACGGGSGNTAQEAAAPLATGITTLDVPTETLSEAAAALHASPSFHAAPLLLDPPDDRDAQDPSASAQSQARQQSIPAEFSQLSSRGLTVQTLASAQRARTMAASGDNVAPMAAATVVSTYTPAQIRAAYGLPPMPAAGSALSASQAAQLGAGQTIYIVNAMHNPYVAAELAAFNQKFGLRGCNSKAIPTTTSLPLAAASTSACELSQVYSTPAGGMTSAVPAYNAGWATEIALDVQWAHATAPLARIVLIEAADPSLNSLLGAVKLANAMGPGVVSMSFGANEGNYTASVDAAFKGAKMTYMAATGDSGVGVSWPAVSPNVVAVGGSSLVYSGTGARTESAWSGSGGGISAYTATPSYQVSSVPGMGVAARRNVADVAFNADPNTGQYVAVQSGGSINWISAGGTSLSTPQWAGLVAVANAMRAQSGKAPLGAAHGLFYQQIASMPGNYASAFADINKGANGTCASCSAKTGYDTPTGLGTPNATSLLSLASGATVASAAPVLTAASISGQVGTALSFTVSAQAANPLAFSLSGAPAGMSIAANGTVSWPTPVAGSYAVTVSAKDSKTGLSGQAVYTITITAPIAPKVASASIAGQPNVALNYTVSTTASNPLSYTLSGAPAGMSISASGVLSWAKPVLGSYNVTVTAKDSKTGLSGQGVISLKIAASPTPPASGLQLTAPAVKGVAGKPLTGTISIAAPGASSLSLSIAGAPLGMGFSISGMTVTAYWPSPITGNYALSIRVVDSAGRQASATMPITITAK